LHFTDTAVKKLLGSLGLISLNPLSPSGTVLYWPHGDDALCMGR